MVRPTQPVRIERDRRLSWGAVKVPTRLGQTGRLWRVVAMQWAPLRAWQEERQTGFDQF